MKPLPRLLPALLGLLLLPALGLAAGKSSMNGTRVLDEKNGVSIEVELVFNPPPPSGCAPVFITAKNPTPDDKTWKFSSTSRAGGRNSHEASGSFVVQVPAKKNISQTLLVPLAADYETGGYSSHNVTLRFNAPGYENQTFQSYDSRVEGHAAIAMSQALAARNLSTLETSLGSTSPSHMSSGKGVFASEFDPSHLPEDWLGYNGFDVVMISDTEWQGASPGARTALVQWARMGGRLSIYAKSPTTTFASLGLPGEKSGSKPFSKGELEICTWNGTDLPPTETIARYASVDGRLNHLREAFNDDKKWPLVNVLASKSFAEWQVIVFLLIFGVLVGPVNLFLLAPAGKRHKLFFTTPLISIGASLILVGLILFQDGTGGKGGRFLAVNVEPGDKTAYLEQDQFSRTGVLLSGGFETKEPVDISQVVMKDSEWTKLKKGGDGSALTTGIDSNRAFSGNWFQSRAEQGQTLRGLTATRAAIVVKSPSASPTAGPTVISQFEFPLTQLYHTDAKGTVWKSPDGQEIKTGVPVALVPADQNALKDFWNKATAPASQGASKGRLERETARNSAFFASASTAPGFLIPTLSSITWVKDTVVLYGSMPE